MANDSKTITLNQEIIKFGVAIGVPLVAVIGSYFQTQSDVQEALRIATENKIKVELVEEHNQQQDLETVAFRTEMTSRVTNIEKLTKDIHAAVIDNGRP